MCVGNDNSRDPQCWLKDSERQKSWCAIAHKTSGMTIAAIRRRRVNGQSISFSGADIYVSNSQ